MTKMMMMVTMMMMMDKTCICADISRGSFPKGFVFGTASSAFQVSSPLQSPTLFVFVYFYFNF